jgi:hypothetical protein
MRETVFYFFGARKQGKPDTPLNMDEEEPDLDKEPSEERRGN